MDFLLRRNGKTKEMEKNRNKKEKKNNNNKRIKETNLANTDHTIQKANVTIHILNHSLVTSLVVTSFNDRLVEVSSRPVL